MVHTYIVVDSLNKTAKTLDSNPVFLYGCGWCRIVLSCLIKLVSFKRFIINYEVYYIIGFFRIELCQFHTRNLNIISILFNLSSRVVLICLFRRGVNPWHALTHLFHVIFVSLAFRVFKNRPGPEKWTWLDRTEDNRSGLRVEKYNFVSVNNGFGPYWFFLKKNNYLPPKTWFVLLILWEIVIYLNF